MRHPVWPLPFFGLPVEEALCLCGLSECAALARWCLQIYVEVVAMVTRPEAVASDVTNTFHFVYRVDGCRPLMRVLPATVDEAHSIRAFCADAQ